MRRILAVLLLSISLGGCATIGQISSNIGAVFTGTKNPVTKADLYAFENTMTIAFAGLNAYKQSCVKGALPASCRTTIRQLQVYTRKIPAALADARAFVKQNDQVNAYTAFQTVQALLDDFKSVATANGVKVQ